MRPFLPVPQGPCSCSEAIFLKYFIFFIILSLQKNTKNYYKNIQGLVKVRSPKDPTPGPTEVAFSQLLQHLTFIQLWEWGGAYRRRGAEISDTASKKGKK